MTNREKFEAWLTEGVSDLNKEILLDKFDNGGYVNHKARIQYEAWQAALASQQPADDGWIEWCGGQRPVDPDKLVELKFRDGEEYAKTKAHIWDWSHDSKDSDDHIIAYRVVKP